MAIAQAFSPRYERHRDHLLSIDVSGLDRLFGTPRIIGEELRREASARGVRVQIAIAATRTAALVLAQARPGLTVVDPGGEAAALAPVPIEILERIHDDQPQPPSRRRRFGEPRRSSWRTPSEGGSTQSSQSHSDQRASAISAISAVKRWGVKTLGELAALPSADLAARLGPEGRHWRAIARGEDVRPLVPDVPEERFESSLELDWPIDGLEPLSFVLTRLLEPLSTRLERRDRGAAALQVALRLVTKEMHARRLELPSPMRDVRGLRTLVLLDLEAHPPPAAVDRVALVIDPTPARVLQHMLFTRAHPTPDQLSTLLARLGALTGQDRIGAPATVDSYRPGAFELRPFATEHDHDDHRGGRKDRRGFYVQDSAISAASALNVVSALRRCRQPVPARVRLEGDRPRSVTTDRCGFAGGAVLHSAGPWRTSGNWWNAPSNLKSEVSSLKDRSDFRFQTSDFSWDRDEWDVALSDGAVYRIFRDRATDGWFIDAIVD